MPLFLALMASAALHAAAITMPGWDLPGLSDPEPAPLEAHLVPPRPVAAATPAKRSPAPVRRPAARTVETPPLAAAPEPPAAPVESTEPAASLPAAEAPSAPSTSSEQSAQGAPSEPAVAPPWPAVGRVRYTVTYGDGGFVIGETIHEWRVADARYSIRSVATPRGLAALRGKTRVQSSAGEVTAAGLRPLEFHDQREGREAESVRFDWTAGTLAFSGGRGESRVAEGTQDLISVFYQLAWQAPRNDLELAVATASRLGRWKFEWLGEEMLEAAGTSMPTLHLRTRADGDVTDVWLAPAHGGLPVKIRHVDRKGDTFEQTADTVEATG